MKKNTVLGVVIAGGFMVLMSLFALGLNNDPDDLDLVIKGEKLPTFSLPNLLDKGAMLDNADLTTDKPYYLINFWGSWCAECYTEHPYLLALSNSETIYGVSWKDTRADALNFLEKGGNPYQQVIVDNNSVLAIAMGVYGAPETFLIAADATIIYRYAGALNAAVWQQEFMPRIEALK